ncbi:unnamed protein product [Vicia faba]|uniref:Ribosomal RNA-processing protein 17 n=1 Tax=Vicia faba TaxID=3906 RepID=A0AAV0ZHF3_VICFA|nr:unnamed protein product [Vicia faba]
MEESTITQRQTSHVKKRVLRNKALGISFDEKDLKDYVTGFHKRKKKRRKEANKQQEEARRRKRNEARLKRKLERDLSYGIVPPNADTETGEIDQVTQQVLSQSVAATKTYENDDLKVTVVTKEINPEEESFPTERKETAPAASPHPVVADKKKSVPVNNKKPFKKVAKHKLRPKQICKRDKRKGKKSGRK